jgi:hypothetical protein
MHSLAAHYFIKKEIARNNSSFSRVYSLVAYPFVSIGDRSSREDDAGFYPLEEAGKLLQPPS